MFDKVRLHGNINSMSNQRLGYSFIITIGGADYYEDAIGRKFEFMHYRRGITSYRFRLCVNGERIENIRLLLVNRKEMVQSPSLIWWHLSTARGTNPDATLSKQSMQAAVV